MQLPRVTQFSGFEPGPKGHAPTGPDITLKCLGSGKAVFFVLAVEACDEGHSNHRHVFWKSLLMF